MVIKVTAQVHPAFQTMNPESPVDNNLRKLQRDCKLFYGNKHLSSSLTLILSK